MGGGGAVLASYLNELMSKTNNKQEQTPNYMPLPPPPPPPPGMPIGNGTHIRPGSTENGPSTKIEYFPMCPKDLKNDLW